jgi:hypothetical protein
VHWALLRDAAALLLRMRSEPDEPASQGNNGPATWRAFFIDAFQTYGL